MNDFFTPERDKLGLRTLGPMRDNLPHVLLIGDSISCGYTEPVMLLLREVCNVRRAPDNCGDTRRGLTDLDAWLGETKWDLIHFNFGLHDIAYRHPEATTYGNRDKVRGTIAVPFEEYQANLEQLVERLLAHTPNLIWASTTIVPPGEAGRFEGDEARYNAAAAGIMQRHGIPINDLHAITTTFDTSMFVGPGDVHFTEAGSQALAEQVARAIRERLP